MKTNNSTSIAQSEVIPRQKDRVNLWGVVSQGIPTISRSFHKCRQSIPLIQPQKWHSKKKFCFNIWPPRLKWAPCWTRKFTHAHTKFRRIHNQLGKWRWNLFSPKRQILRNSHHLEWCLPGRDSSRANRFWKCGKKFGKIFGLSSYTFYISASRTNISGRTL